MKDTSEPREPFPSGSESFDSVTKSIIDYLEQHLPGYPFQHSLDTVFVEELRADFPDVDLLGEIKILRWYLNDQPICMRNPRATLRRWVARARPHQRR